MKLCWWNTLVCCVLAAAIYSAYSSVPDHGFLTYDDKSVLLENPRLEAPGMDSAIALFTEVRDEAWLPLWYLSYFPELSLARGSARAVHVASLLWHLLGAWLVYLLASVLLRERSAAFFAALLFALHPLAAESVAWASGRKDQVSLVFLLLALLACAKCWRRPRGLPWLATVMILLGSFAKGTTVVAPLLAALLWFMLRAAGRIAAERRARGSFIVLGLAAALPALLHYCIALKQGTAAAGEHGFLERCQLGAAALLRYCSHLLWPTNLSIHAAEPTGSLWVVVMAAALIAGLLAYFALQRQRQPKTAALLLWIPAALLPFNTVFPATSLWYADRYASMALPGLCVLLAALCARLPKLLAVILAVCVLVVLLLLTRQRSAEFRDDATLFGAAQILEPLDPMIPAQLAEGLFGATASLADQEAALALLRQSLTLAERGGKQVLLLRAHVRLGDVLLASGRAAEALPHHAAALAIAGQDAYRMQRLGLDLADLRANHIAGLVATGALADAQSELEIALHDISYSASLSLLQGRLMLRAGLKAIASTEDTDALAFGRERVEMALVILRSAATSPTPALAALALSERGEALLVAAWIPKRYAEVRAVVEELQARFPQRSEGLLLSSRLREEGGDLPGSLRDLMKALELDVRDLSLFARASRMLLRAGENRRAAEVLRAGLRVDPQSALLRTELCNLLLAQSRRHLNAQDAALALRAAEEALKLLPEAPETHVAMGDAFAALGRWEPAQAAWQAALDIDAAHRDARRGMARYLQARGLGTLADLQRVVRALPEAERAAKEQELRDRVMADFRRSLELGGDWEELGLARRHLEEVTERERRDAGQDLQNRARASLAAGRTTEALELARNAVRVDGTSVSGQFLLARAELAGGDRDAALKALSATLALEPTHLGALGAAAQLHFIKGDSEDALRCAEAFVRGAGAHSDADLKADVERMKALIERLKR